MWWQHSGTRFFFNECRRRTLLIWRLFRSLSLISMENPSTHSDLELFTRELTWDTRTTINKLYSPTLFGALGFGLALTMNYFQRRPVMSGIQRHIAFVAIGVPVGLYADQLNQNRLARRDAILVHYIRNHPEDFPVTERIKYKDVLDKWLPRR